MIESVNSYNQPKPNPFGKVSNRTSNADYWIGEIAKQSDKEESILGSILPETIILNPDEARKTKNLKIIGWSIASATLLAAATIFILLQGGPKGAAKGFQKLRDIVERKIQKTKLANMRGTPHYEFLLGKIDSLLGKAEAVNNFTTIKDFTFKKLMYGGNNNWKFTRKIHEGITNMFEKLGLKTLSISYSGTSKKFANLKSLNQEIFKDLSKSSNLSEQITINGVSRSKQEWLEYARNAGQDIDALFNDNFGDTVRRSRYLKIKKFTKELEQSFEAKGPLWFLSKDTLKTFVAEAKMLPNKLQIQNQISGIRQLISYNPYDLYKSADNSIMKISSFLRVSDKEALILLNKIRNSFKSFSKGGKIDYDEMIKDFDDLNSLLLNSVNSGSPASKTMISHFDNLKSLFINYKQGKVQDILDVYKALLPENKYNKIVKSFEKTVSSLDKSIKLETEDFINKSRDLAMGSAPTDILTVLTGLGTLAFYLGKSDNKQERVEINLKYGIPALIGIGVSLYGNARLFAGSKSLLFASLSSIVANRLGNIANKLYVNHLKKNGEYIQPQDNLSDSNG